MLEAVQQCEAGSVVLTERVQQMEAKIENLDTLKVSTFDQKLIESTDLLDASLEEHRVALGCISTWASRCDEMLAEINSAAGEDRSIVEALSQRVEAQQSCLEAQQKFIQAP
jgi:hypothetical protein